MPINVPSNASLWPDSRIEQGNPRPLKRADIVGNQRQAVLQRRRCDDEIGLRVGVS